MTVDPQRSEALTTALEGDGIVTNLYYYLWRYLQYVDTAAKEEGGYTSFTERGAAKSTASRKEGLSGQVSPGPQTYRAQMGVLTQLAQEARGREEQIVISAAGGSPRRVVTINKQSTGHSRPASTTMNHTTDDGRASFHSSQRTQSIFKPSPPTSSSKTAKKKRTKKGPKLSHAESVGITFPLLMPATIIIEQNYPKAWYNHMDDDDLTMPPARRLGKDIEVTHILREFLAETSDADEMHTLLLQQQMSLVGGKHGHAHQAMLHNYAGTGSPTANFGSGGGQQSLNSNAAVDKLFNEKYRNGQIVAAYFNNNVLGSKHCVAVEYLDGYGLRELLTRRNDRPAGFIQKWVQPPGPCNSAIQAVWSPSGCYLTRRLNNHSVSDTRVPMYERAMTFEGEAAAPHYCIETEIAPHIQAYMRAVCSDFVKYIQVVHSISLKRMVLHFKVDSENRLWVLWASSTRTVSTELVNIAMRFVPSSVVDSQKVGFQPDGSTAQNVNRSTRSHSILANATSLSTTGAGGDAILEAFQNSETFVKSTRPRTAQSVGAMRHRQRYFSPEPCYGVAQEVFAVAASNPLIDAHTAAAISGVLSVSRRMERSPPPPTPSEGIKSKQRPHTSAAAPANAASVAPAPPTPLNSTDLVLDNLNANSTSVGGLVGLLGSPTVPTFPPPLLGGLSPIPLSPSNLNLSHIRSGVITSPMAQPVSPRERSFSSRDRGYSTRERGASMLARDRSTSYLGLGGSHTPTATRLRGYSRRPKSTSVGPNGVRAAGAQVELPTSVPLRKDPRSLWDHVRWAVRSGWLRDRASIATLQEWFENTLYQLHSLNSLNAAVAHGSPRPPRIKNRRPSLGNAASLEGEDAPNQPSDGLLGQRPTDPSRYVSVPVKAIASLAKFMNKIKAPKHPKWRRNTGSVCLGSGNIDCPTEPSKSVLGILSQVSLAPDSISDDIREGIALTVSFLGRMGLHFGVPIKIAQSQERVRGSATVLRLEVRRTQTVQTVTSLRHQWEDACLYMTMRRPKCQNRPQR